MGLPSWCPRFEEPASPRGMLTSKVASIVSRALSTAFVPPKEEEVANTHVTYPSTPAGRTTVYVWPKEATSAEMTWTNSESLREYTLSVKSLFLANTTKIAPVITLKSDLLKFTISIPAYLRESKYTSKHRYWYIEIEGRPVYVGGIVAGALYMAEKARIKEARKSADRSATVAKVDHEGSVQLSGVEDDLDDCAD